LALLCVAALAGCQQTPPPAELSPADVTAIRATSERWLTAVRAGRWDDAAATYTDDAVFWLAGSKFEGRAAIRQFLGGMQAWDTTRGLVIDEIHGRGDMAFVAGHGTAIPDGGGIPVVVSHYMDIRLRQADGSWRYYRDMVSPVPPATSAKKKG